MTTGELEACLNTGAPAKVGALNLALHLQPQIDVSTGQVVGAEALLRAQRGSAVQGPRWVLRRLGRTALAPALTHWGVQQAIMCLARINTPERELRVSVNVPPEHFTCELAELIDRALARFQVPARSLCLEMLESELPDPCFLEAQRSLRALRQIGVEVAMDDFGVGASQFERLAQFPFTAIELDKRFLVPFQPGFCHQSIRSEAQGFLEDLVHMARVHRVRLVAEGVECREQLEAIGEAGVGCWQGFLASPALPEPLFHAVIDHEAPAPQMSSTCDALAFKHLPIARTRFSTVSVENSAAE